MTGFKDLPQFGDEFSQVKNEKAARTLHKQIVLGRVVIN